MSLPVLLALSRPIPVALCLPISVALVLPVPETMVFSVLVPLFFPIKGALVLSSSPYCCNQTDFLKSKFTLNNTNIGKLLKII
jgi:hypothetical protein